MESLDFQEFNLPLDHWLTKKKKDEEENVLLSL